MPQQRPVLRRLVGRSLVGTIAAMAGISFAPANAAPPAPPDPLVAACCQGTGQADPGRRYPTDTWRFPG